MNAVARFMFTNRTWGQIVLKNATWSFAGEGASRILKLVATFVIVRAFGPTDFGRFTFAFAIATLLSIAFDVGMVTVLTREYAKDPARMATLPDMLGLKFTVGAIVMLVATGLAFVVTSDRTITYMIMVLAGSLFLAEVVNLGFAVLRARQRMEYEATIRALSGAVLLTVVGAMLGHWGWWRYGEGATATIFDMAGAYLIASIGTVILVTLPLTRNLGWHPSIRFRPRTWWPILKVALPLALAGGAMALYVNMDAAMLGWYGRLTEAGLYGAAIRVNGVAVVPMSIMGLVFFPALSQLASDRAEFTRRWNGWVLLSTLIGIGLTTVVILGADLLVRIAFGAEFASAAGVLRVTILGIGLMYAYFPWMQRLIIQNRQILLLYVVGGAAILNVALNAALIPSFGMYGAAWATVATHAVIFACLVISGRRRTEP